jgi:hypothetical protein
MSLSDDERKSRLSSAVAFEVSQGWRIDSQTDHMVALTRGGDTSHVLHFLLTLFTLGLWGIIWLIRGLSNFKSRKILSVDLHGKIIVS